MAKQHPSWFARIRAYIRHRSVVRAHIRRLKLDNKLDKSGLQLYRLAEEEQRLDKQIEAYRGLGAHVEEVEATARLRRLKIHQIKEQHRRLHLQQKRGGM